MEDYWIDENPAEYMGIPPGWVAVVCEKHGGHIAYFQYEEDAKNFIQMKRIFFTDKPTPPPPPRVR